MIDFTNDVLFLLLFIFIFFFYGVICKLQTSVCSIAQLAFCLPIDVFLCFVFSLDRRARMGVCFPRQQRGWCTILKAVYTNALCCHACAFPHTCTRKVHIYYEMTKKRSRAVILVSKEHLTLFFYPSPSLFSQRRPFTFRPPHSLSSSALPSSLIKP